MDENYSLTSLKLDWYKRNSKYLAYDFGFEDPSKAIAFINRILQYSQQVDYYPDLIFHKKNHVRIELYDKTRGSFTSAEIRIAAEIENIYLNEFS